MFTFKFSNENSQSTLRVCVGEHCIANVAMDRDDLFIVEIYSEDGKILKKNFITMSTAYEYALAEALKLKRYKEFKFDDSLYRMEIVYAEDFRGCFN